MTAENQAQQAISKSDAAERMLDVASSRLRQSYDVRLDAFPASAVLDYAESIKRIERIT